MLRRHLTRIQRTGAGFLTQRCKIEAETETRGDMGEPLHVWAMVADDVPCRVIQAGQFNAAAVQVVGSQETLPEMYRLALPPETPLDVDQRVTVDGVTYNVVRMETALTDEVFRHALIVRR